MIIMDGEGIQEVGSYRPDRPADNAQTTITPNFHVKRLVKKLLERRVEKEVVPTSTD